MHGYSQLLKKMGLFKALTPKELEQISSIIHPSTVVEGETVIRRGAPAQIFYIVLSGDYLVYFKNGRSFTLHYKGDIFGYTTVVTPFKYSGTVVALTDGEVLTISGQNFLRLIQGNSSLGEKIMKTIYQTMSERLPFVK